MYTNVSKYQDNKLVNQRKAQNIRARILPPLILAILFFQGTFIYVFSKAQQNRITDSKQVTTQRVEDLMQAELKADTDKMKAALESVIRDPILMKAFADRDRAAITEREQPVFERLKDQIQVTHFYFHQPDRVNFLRLHKERKGDLIDRRTIKSAQKTRQPSAGLEQGPTGNPVLRVVYPWRSDYPQRKDSNLFVPPWQGELVGFVELGIELEDIAQRIHKLLNVDLILAMDKDFLNQERWEKRNKKLGRQSAWGEFSDYVIIDKTIENIPEGLTQAIAKSKTTIDPNLTLKKNGKTFQVIFVPLIDIDGRNLGNIVVVDDISRILQLSRQSIITTSIISMLIGGGLIAVFYVFLGKVEENIAERNAELTAAKIKEVELEQSKKVADAASEAKSEFLANMSHELRTPLNGILGYVQILRRTERLTKKGHKGVEIIQQCGHHLLELINDILDLSKIEARKLELNPSDFYLPSFFEGVTEICRVRAEQKNIDFHVELDANLPDAIHADEKRLRQVLINLIGNAIKFTHKGSVTLVVKTQPVTSEDSPIRRFRFEVIDTGVGMTAEDLEKIFQPFEQVGDRKQQAEGTGLGLAISQKIISLMDSQLEVKSEFGKGSNFSFEVELPEAKDWAETSTVVQQGKIVGYQGEKRTILVIDDKWENRSVIVNLLEPIGFKAIEATDGQDGFEKTIMHKPDLILTDLIMPVMDGFELLKRLAQSQNLKAIPAIASSASVFETDLYKSIDAGAKTFIPKPIEAEVLIRELQQHLQLEWIYETEKDSIKENELATVTPELKITSEIFQNDSKLAAVTPELQITSEVSQNDSKLAAVTPDLERLIDTDEIYPPMIVGYKGEKRTILVVDDTAKNRSLIADLLEPVGFIVIEANNGKEGLEKASANSPHLIITDLMMPVMTGFQFISCLRKSSELKDMPVIVSSCSELGTQLYKNIDTSTSVFIEKPVDADILMKQLELFLKLEWIYDDQIATQAPFSH